jgi:hypothetical protein
MLDRHHANLGLPEKNKTKKQRIYRLAKETKDDDIASQPL